MILYLTVEFQISLCLTWTWRTKRRRLRPGALSAADIRGQGQRPRVPGCDGAGTAEKSYPASEAGGGGWRSNPTPRPGAVAGKSNPTSKERWLRGRRRAQRSYPTLKVRKGRGEAILFIQGKEQRLCFAGAPVKRYTMPKVRETQVRWQVLQEGIRGQTH